MVVHAQSFQLRICGSFAHCCLSSVTGGSGHQHAADVRSNSFGCHSPVRLLGSAQCCPLAHERTPKSPKITLRGSAS